MHYLSRVGGEALVQDLGHDRAPVIVTIKRLAEELGDNVLINGLVSGEKSALFEDALGRTRHYLLHLRT